MNRGYDSQATVPHHVDTGRVERLAANRNWRHVLRDERSDRPDGAADWVKADIGGVYEMGGDNSQQR